jgi:hypothetical protein
VPQPIPADPLAARLLALCRETEEVCAALAQAVAQSVDGLRRFEPAHLGQAPAALERAAAAAERARKTVRQADERISGAGNRNGGRPAPAP